MRVTLFTVSFFSRLGISLLEAMMSNTVSFTNPVTAAITIVYNPSLWASNNFVTQYVSFLKDAPALVHALLNIVLLYSPTVFAGDRIWIWIPFAVLGMVTALSLIIGVFIK